MCGDLFREKEIKKYGIRYFETSNFKSNEIYE